MHVLVPPSPGLVVVEPVAIPPVVSAHLEAGQVVSVNEQLKKLAGELGGEVEIQVTHGATIEQLLDAASSADLVVVGTEGKTLLPNHVAIELARRGDVPVLACPVDGDRAIATALFAVDFNETTLGFATTAANLVGDAELVEIFHVHPSAGELDVEGVNRDARWIEVVAARTRTDATVRGYVGRGSLAPALLERAETIGADLIAIGAEPTDSAQPLGLAEDLIGETSLPLLLVPVADTSAPG